MYFRVSDVWGHVSNRKSSIPSELDDSYCQTWRTCRMEVKQNIACAETYAVISANMPRRQRITYT